MKWSSDYTQDDLSKNFTCTLRLFAPGEDGKSGKPIHTVKADGWKKKEAEEKACGLAIERLSMHARNKATAVDFPGTHGVGAVEQPCGQARAKLAGTDVPTMHAKAKTEASNISSMNASEPCDVAARGTPAWLSGAKFGANTGLFGANSVKFEDANSDRHDMLGRNFVSVEPVNRTSGANFGTFGAKLGEFGAKDGARDRESVNVSGAAGAGGSPQRR